MSEKNDKSAPKERPQFSLRWLLIAITAFGVLLGLILQTPDLIAVPVLSAFLLVMPVAIVVAMCRGAVRSYGAAFCVGALFGIVGSLSFVGYRIASIISEEPRPFWQDDSDDARRAELLVALRAAALLELMLAPSLGILAVGIRWATLRLDELPTADVVDGHRATSILSSDDGDEASATDAFEEFDRITFDPSVMNGQPCIRGMRLTVRRVLEAMATYPDRKELFAEYPDLDEEDLRQALKFAAGNLEI